MKCVHRAHPIYNNTYDWINCIGSWFTWKIENWNIKIWFPFEILKGVKLKNHNIKLHTFFSNLASYSVWVLQWNICRSYIEFIGKKSACVSFSIWKSLYSIFYCGDVVKHKTWNERFNNGLKVGWYETYFLYLTFKRFISMHSGWNCQGLSTFSNRSNYRIFGSHSQAAEHGKGILVMETYIFPTIQMIPLVLLEKSWIVGPKKT